MKVIDLINHETSTRFSFELLPPLKGNNINKVFNTIDVLKEFNPQYINITTHHSEENFRTTAAGLFERYSIRKRPGTVAIAAAIQHKYKIKVVPHIICSGFTKEETEYALMDLNFLGITDLLVLRGDQNKQPSQPPIKTEQKEHAHAIDLQKQINNWNNGTFLDGTEMEMFETPFSYGVAGYPEKHEEAPNLKSDIYWLKEKVKAGAEYIVTQMFFDNQKYFEFVKLCRSEGITVPIIPGLKPITLPNQLTVLPRIFSCEIPELFATELRKCKTKEEVTEVGIEWCTLQAQELKQQGAPIIHFYTMMATQSVKRVAEKIY